MGESDKWVEYPLMSYPLIGLANLYRQQGRYAEAELRYQRALHIREQQFGSEYPGLGHPLAGLVSLYQRAYFARFSSDAFEPGSPAGQNTPSKRIGSFPVFSIQCGSRGGK